MIKIKETIESIQAHIDLKKGEDIQVIPLEGRSSLADFILIATGLNPRHVMSLAREVEDQMAKMDMSLYSKEGHQDGQWVLLDFGDAIIHLFTEETRMFYNLERLYDYD